MMSDAFFPFFCQESDILGDEKRKLQQYAQRWAITLAIMGAGQIGSSDRLIKHVSFSAKGGGTETPVWFGLDESASAGLNVVSRQNHQLKAPCASISPFCLFVVVEPHTRLPLHTTPRIFRCLSFVYSPTT